MNRLDSTRATLLSLVPSELPESRKRSLAIEIERADFSKKTTLDYYINIVGIDNFNKGPQPVQDGERNRSLAKIFCHGGDCALLGGVDLEYESQINATLFGHAHKRKRVGISDIVVPDLSISLVDKRVKQFTTLTVPPRFVAAAQRAMGLVLMQILSESHRIKDSAGTSRRRKKVLGDLVNIHKVLGNTDINCAHVLDAVVKHGWPRGEEWEKRIIERISEIASEQIGPFFS